MYTVNTATYDDFLDAVRAAKPINADVYEVATGLRRWTPAQTPNAKAMRLYQERLAAYRAQQASR